MAELTVKVYQAVVQAEVQAAPAVEVVEVIHPGPQGPQGLAGGGGATQLDDLADVNTTARVNKSVLYYDGATSTFKADAIWTTSELTDGGNF